MSVLAGCWLVKNLAGVVTWFAASSLPEYSLHLGRAEFAGFSRIEFTGLEVRTRDQRKTPVAIASATVDYSFADLWHRHLPRVEIENPHVALDDETLNAAATPKSAATEESESWRVDRFVIRGGEASLDLGALGQMHLEFAGEFTGLDLGSRASSSEATQQLVLRNLRVVRRDNLLGEIGSARATFTFAEVAQHRVRQLVVTAPSVHLRPELFAGSSNSTAAPGGWQIGRLTIKDGELFLEGFGNSIPMTSAKFAVDTKEIGLGGASELSHRAHFWDVRAAAAFDPLHPFLQLESATLEFSNAGLARSEIARIAATGLWVDFGRQLRSLAAPPGTAAAGPETARPSPPWKVRDLAIESGYVAVSDIGLEIPNLGFSVRTLLHDVALSADDRVASKALQTVELSNISIHSPLDPFVPVLNLKTIFLRFSIAQLLREEIEEVSILNPQIFVGEDLFWYADALKKKQESAAGTPATTTASAHWVVKKLGADFGQIIIANSGAKTATLPLSFSWRAQNLDFNRLDDLQLKLKLVIPPGDYPFPSYELELSDLSGRIEFGLPPAAHRDNLVHTLEVKGIQWKQFAAENGFVTVTYDKLGIYGSLGGKAYGGYLNGGFSFFSRPDSLWTGWLSGSAVSLRGLTEVLAPQSFQLSGPADFTVDVNGLNHEIQRLAGTYTMPKPGKLRVTKLDELLRELPPDWTLLKTSVTRIGLETLRDFDYQSGHGSFWYAKDEGNLSVALKGPTGSRVVEAVLHAPRHHE